MIWKNEKVTYNNSLRSFCTCLLGAKLFIISIVNDENVKCFGHKRTEDTDVLHVFRDALIACLGNNECALCLCIRSQEMYP